MSPYVQKTTGTMGYSPASARWKAPFLNGNISSLCDRVPSGYIHTDVFCDLKISAAPLMVSIAASLFLRSIKTCFAFLTDYHECESHNSRDLKLTVMA